MQSNQPSSGVTARFFDYPTNEGVDRNDATCVLTRPTGEDVINGIWDYVLGRLAAIDIDDFAGMLSNDFPSVRAAIESGENLASALTAIFGANLGMKARFCEYYFVFASGQTGWVAELNWDLPIMTLPVPVFIKAERKTFHSVEVSYSFGKDEFTVEWNGVHPGSGIVGGYNLQVNVKSTNDDLAYRISQAILGGEAGDNIDSEIYLTIRDSFNATDCIACDTPTFEISTEEMFDADYYGNNRFIEPINGRDDEFGLGDWCYQFQVLVTNQTGDTEAFSVAYQPEERNNQLKHYSGYEIVPAHLYGCDADESKRLEEFCNHNSTVLEQLYEIAKSKAKLELERQLKLLECKQ